MQESECPLAISPLHTPALHSPHPHFADMKPHLLPLARRISAVGLAMLAVVASAQFTAITDDFSTTGNLTGSTPDSGVGSWTLISGTTGSIQVSGGSLTINGAGTTEAAQVNFASSNLTSGTIYLGFDFNLATQTISTTASASAIAGFRTGTAASGSYALGFATFRPGASSQSANSLPSTTTSQFDVGIFSGSSATISTAGTISGWASALNMGTTYRAVIGLNLTTDTASLWINPTSSGSTSITLSAVAADIRGVFLRQGATSHGVVGMDNLAVSMDFNTAAAIPEPSTYAAIFGALALAGVALQRRRAKAIQSTN